MDGDMECLRAVELRQPRRGKMHDAEGDCALESKLSAEGDMQPSRSERKTQLPAWRNRGGRAGRKRNKNHT